MTLRLLAAILVLELAGPADAAAQRRNPGSLRGTISGRNISDATQKPARPVRTTIVEVEKDDTVYTTATETVRSWQIPLGTISEEKARLMPWSVRMTNRNKSGHYGRIEVLDPQLGPGVYEFMPDIIGMAPDSLRKEDFQSVKASRIDYISDAEGVDVFQERLYDDNNNLLMYVVNMPLFADNGVKAREEFYFGPDGLPVSPVNTPAGMSGSVRIVHFYLPDSTTVSGMFAGTERIPMVNGEYFIRHKYSPDNRRYEKASFDKQMQPMINSKGYCMEVTFRGADMAPDSIVYFDTEERPMVVGKEGSDSTLIGVSKRVFRFDDMEQLREERYFGLNDEPVENAYGTHVSIYETNDRNQRTAARALALDGSAAPYDGNGASWWTARYDSLNRVLEYHQYDTLGRPTGSISSFYYEYEPDGSIVLEKRYNADNGSEKLVYGFEKENGVERRTEADGSTTVKYFDRKGRIVRSVTRDSMGNPLETDSEYPLAEWTYTDRPDSSVLTRRRLFDQKNRLVAEALADSAARTYATWEYDTLGRVTNSYMLEYDEGWNTPVAQNHIDLAGNIIRSKTLAQPLSYKVVVDHTMKGEFFNFRGLDEFGEPDYIVFDDGDIAAINTQNSPHTSGWAPRDAAGEPIEDMDELRNRTPKYLSVEITDSKASVLGLRDNDLILRYGAWEPSPVEIISPADYLAAWTKAAVSEASRPKEVVVFRIDSVKPERYGLYHLELPAGTTRDLGFITHLTYKTPKQTERIFRAMVQDGFKMPAVSPKASGHSAIAAYPQMRSDFRVSDYALEVGAPSLLSYAYCEEYPHLSWKAGENVGKATNLIGLIRPDAASGLHLRAYFFDGREVKPLTLHAGNSDNLLRLVETSVGDSLFADMQAAMPSVKALSASPVREPYAAASALLHYGFSKEALPLLEAEAEVGDANAATLATLMHFIGRGTKKNIKKAMHFSDLALKALPEDAILRRAQLLALNNRRDAVRYVADAVYDYKPAGKAPIEVYRELVELKDFVEQFADEAPVDVDNALVHMAVLASSVGLQTPYVIKEFMKGPIRHDRLVTPRGDFSALAYSFMFDSAEDNPEIKQLYDEYMAAHVPVFVIPEDPDSPAYARGMRGVYIIVRMNDWNMYSDFNWVDYNRELAGMPKRVLLIAPDGNMVEETFDDRIGARFFMRKADAATHERVKQLIIESSEDEIIHPD